MVSLLVEGHEKVPVQVACTPSAKESDGDPWAGELVHQRGLPPDPGTEARVVP